MEEEGTLRQAANRLQELLQVEPPDEVQVLDQVREKANARVSRV